MLHMEWGQQKSINLIKYKVKRYLIIIGIIVSLILINRLVSLYSDTVDEFSDDDVECFGVIMDKKRHIERGAPYFLIDGKWQYIGIYGYNIDDNVLLSDSLAKPKNQKKVQIYRRRHDGSYWLYA